MNDEKEKKKCVCYSCGKVSYRTYNFTKRKWARKFKCSCGCGSFQYYNY